MHYKALMLRYQALYPNFGHLLILTSTSSKAFICVRLLAAIKNEIKHSPCPV